MFTLGPLAFLSPLILIALASLPLIWWLLRATPPAPEKVRFPAFIILRRLTQKEETPDKTPWWLLLLRLLLTAFIIIGLAGPILNAPQTNQTRGPLILVIDNSYMAAPAWNLRKTAIERVAQTVEQTDRPIFIVTTTPNIGGIEEMVDGPLSANETREQIDQITPQPFRTDRQTTLNALEILDEKISNLGENSENSEIIWLLDDLASEQTGPSASNPDQLFANALAQRGELTAYRENIHQGFVITRIEDNNQSPGAAPPEANLRQTDGVSFLIKRLNTASSWFGSLVATARDGRILDQHAIEFETGEDEIIAEIKLPLALQNELSHVRIENIPSAASTWLADARNRKALIGLPGLNRQNDTPLLDGYHYIKQALLTYGAFQEDDIPTLINANASVIILDDVAAIREEDLKNLTSWIENGGVLIRFSGPRLADAALDGTPALLPVTLRRGERAFGGALTWDTPQPLNEFTKEGPLADLAVPKDILIRQQILAQPGGETSQRSWASLQDGTPLITGIQRGQGLIVLFHVTATPLWSDLPISEVFIDILRKLTFLSTLGPETLEENISTQNAIRYSPIRMLDGYGRFVSPDQSLNSITLTQANARPNPAIPPGLYGSSQTPLAVNAVSPEEKFQRLSLTNITTLPYVEKPPVRLWAIFFSLALLALLLDMIATLFLSGRLGRMTKKVKDTTIEGTTAALIIFCFSTLLIVIPNNNALAQSPTLLAPKTLTETKGIETKVTIATPTQTPNTQTITTAQRIISLNPNTQKQPLDLDINQSTIDATLTTRFGYVTTGDDRIDRISMQGLSALSQELSRRTTISPGIPDAVELGKTDISVYPILYWPVVPGMETYSDEILAEIENFMRLGGLIIFDTKDDEKAIGNVETAEAATLRLLLSRIDIPPLTPLPRDHVLTRSYYLVSDMKGRFAIRNVWVAVGGAINDGVSPLIIGGRDWAGAWARLPDGTPALPMITGANDNQLQSRELAFRTGINMVMMAFTGNYKTDQVHTKTLLERLGEQ